MMDPRLRLFVRLFRGRSDAYGTWTGGCVRDKLTPEHFRDHLLSNNPDQWIGVYNVIGTECSWGVVDIDVDDVDTMQRVRAYLSRRNIPAWIEKTTRGYHLWCFPQPALVDASTMRRALTAACKAVGYTPKEVFPKQDRTTVSGLGNYVRLPLNGAMAPSPCPQTRLLIDGASLNDMDVHRADVWSLRRLADTLPRPQTVDIDVDFQAGLEYSRIARRIGGVPYRIWRDGPLMGNDRSTTLTSLAHRLFEAGVEPDVALGLVHSADQRWGKHFADRGDAGMEILRKIVSNAYGRVA